MNSESNYPNYYFLLLLILLYIQLQTYKLLQGIILACLVALACAGTNGAVVQNEVISYGKAENQMGFTSRLIKILDTEDVLNGDADQELRDQIAIFEAVLGRNLAADTIRNVLESFRDVVINGNDDLPPLDPLVFNHIGPFVYTYTGVRLTANIHNFRMEGLRWYVVNDVTFSLLRLGVGVKMTLPWLIFTGSYDATAVIAFVSHRAGGSYRIFINRIDVDTDLRLGTNVLGGHLLLRELNINIDVHDIQIQITGMTGSSVLNSLISSLMQSVAQDFINNEMEHVSQMISEELFDVINEFLRDFTLDDLLG